MARKQLGATPSNTTDAATKAYVDSGIASLANKTLDNSNSLTVKDANFTLQDDGDATKQLKFELSGITASNTRTLTVPNASTTIVGTDTSQTLTNKTLGNSNSLTIKDTNFTMQDDGDATKQVKFELSGITASNTRTLTVPDANTTIVGTDATQTLTNKTISGATNTFSNIPTTALPYSAMQTVTVATSESTTSTSYTDLTTTTDTVTVTVGASGTVMVIIYTNWTASAFAGYLSYAVSGANTSAAADGKSVNFVCQVGGNTITGAGGVTLLETGLSPGSTTFKLKYKTTNGSYAQTFSNRRITVIPL